jgi:hypothetical protein
MLSDSFAGISPTSALAFITAQFVGGAGGAWLSDAFGPEHSREK